MSLTLAACGGGGGGGSDVIAPALVATDPADAAELVPLTSSVSVTFDEEMDPASLTTDSFRLEANGQRLATNLHYDARTATLTPVAPLPGGTLVTAQVTTDVRDASGNPLAGTIEWAFSTPYPGLALSANTDDGTLSSLRVEPETGFLTHASFVSVPGAPGALGVHRNGRWVYALLSVANQLAAFELEPASGALTLIDPPTATGATPSALALAPNGRFAWVANLDDDTLSTFTLDPRDGQPAPSGVLATGNGPIALAVDAAGRTLFAACRAGRELVSYAIDGTSGALSEVATFALPVGPRALALDPSGRFLYVLSTSGYSLGVLAVGAGGVLTAVQTIDTGGDAPVALGLDPAGRYAYVAFETSESLGAFRIDSAAGTLTEIGLRLPVGGAPRQVTVDPSGRFVHVACFSSSEFVTFARDAVTGEPSEASRMISRKGPLGLAFAPSATRPGERLARRMFVPLPGSDELATLTLDPYSGSASVSDVQPTGDEPNDVAVDPRGRFVLLANARSDTLTLHALDSATGTITPTPLDTLVVGDYPASLALSLDGRHVVSANISSGDLSVVQVDFTNGELTLLQSVSVPGRNPFRVAFEPSGSIVFALTTDQFFPNFLRAYALDPARGELTEVAEIEVGIGAIDLALDPRGRYVFVAHSEGSGGVTPVRFESATGTLVALPPLVIGDKPGGLVCDPRGRNLYVTGNSMGILTGFAIERGTDTFTSLLAFPPAGARPRGLTLEPNGRFGYVADPLTDEIVLMLFDAQGIPSASGTSVPLGAVPVAPRFLVGP